MVALTGVEPAGRQSSSVQLSLSSCVFGLVQFATRACRAVRMADVLPRCCRAARIRLLAGTIQYSPTGSSPESLLRAQSNLLVVHVTRELRAKLWVLAGCT